MLFVQRNLKNLGDMGLSAKKEINARIEQTKKDIDDMIKVRVPLMKFKVVPQMNFYFNRPMLQFPSSNFICLLLKYVRRIDGRYCCTVVPNT